MMMGDSTKSIKHLYDKNMNLQGNFPNRISKQDFSQFVRSVTRDFNEMEIQDIFNVLTKKSGMGGSIRRSSNRPLTANRVSPQKDRTRSAQRKPAWAKGKD